MEVKAVRLDVDVRVRLYVINSVGGFDRRTNRRIPNAARRRRARRRGARERKADGDERTSLDETAGMALAVMEISRDNLPKNGWKIVSNGNGKVHTRFVPRRKLRGEQTPSRWTPLSAGSYLECEMDPRAASRAPDHLSEPDADRAADS